MYSRRVAKFLISKMPFPVLYETFYQSARALGIRSYEITGSTGAFFGPTYDQSVIESYLRTGSWSTNLVGLFQHFFEQAGKILLRYRRQHWLGHGSRLPRPQGSLRGLRARSA